MGSFKIKSGWKNRVNDNICEGCQYSTINRAKESLLLARGDLIPGKTEVGGAQIRRPRACQLVQGRAKELNSTAPGPEGGRTVADRSFQAGGCAPHAVAWGFKLAYRSAR
jgi:hypothetical protein